MTQTPTARSLWQGGMGAPSKSISKEKGARRRMALLIFFGFEVFCLTVLQKIVIPINLGTLGGPVEAVLPLTYLALLILLFFVDFKVDIRRLALISVFFLCAFISIMIQTNAYSVNSVILMVAVYLPFILYIEVSDSTYKKLLNIYLTFMIFFGGIIFLQHIIQLIWSWRAWPNMDHIVPPEYLFDGFIYTSPISYGSHYNRPQAIFFLEPSYISQWTAIALALELVYFRRVWRMVFYAVVLLCCFAGTGMLLLLICAPVLLGRLSRRTLGIVAVMLAVIVVTIISINWVGQVGHRFTEIQRTNSSAYHRFIVPFEILSKFTQNVSSIWVGEGPGTGNKERNEFWWVTTKLTYEYGFLTTLSFLAFFGYCLFKSAPSQRIAFMFMVFFNFMGGFIIPVYPMLIMMIGCLFRIRSPKSA